MSKRVRDEQQELLDGLEAPTRPEVVVLRLRRHGRRLTLPVIALLAIAIASGIWVGALPEAWINLMVAAGAALLLLGLVLLPLLFWLTERITVTTRRLILRRGIFSRHRSEIALSRVREVSSRQTLLQRLFRSGDIQLHVGSDVRLVPDVPDVVGTVDALQALIERDYEESMRGLSHTSRVTRRTDAPAADDASESFWG